MPFVPTPEVCDENFPFLLTTGRTLYQFNAGTMTQRTPNALLRANDTLDMAPSDAARLSLEQGDLISIRSRHGETCLPMRIDPRVCPGELFATFHTETAALNRVTGPHRDSRVMTPEYKVVAVALEKKPR